MDDLIFKTISLILGSVISGVGTLLVWQFKQIKSDFRDMNKNLGSLNEKMAVMISDQIWHKERIEYIEKRVRELEKNPD